MAANSRFAVAIHILTAIAHMSRCAPRKVLSESGLVRCKYLAGSVGTHPVVVRRMVAQFTRAGLIISHQGKGGGVELARPSEKITLCDIYIAVDEGDIFAFNPNTANPKCLVSSKMARVLTPIFREVEQGVRERLRRTKLSDLVKMI